MDAFLDGAVGYDSSSDDGYTGAIKRRNKKIRKLLHQEKLMEQGKWPPKQTNDEDRDRVIKLSNGVSFQRKYKKQRKPLTGLTEVIITHVESTKDIYVRIKPFEEYLKGDIEDNLADLYDGHYMHVPCLPSDYIAVDTPCVTFEIETGRWYRCRITEVCPDGVWLHAVDVGKRLSFVESFNYSRLRVLLQEPCIDLPPLAFHCRINNLCDNQPTNTETMVLRQLLTPGEVLKGEFMERSREPYRLRLYCEHNKSMEFSEYLEEELTKRGLRGIIEEERSPCKALSVYQPPKLARRVANSSSSGRCSPQKMVNLVAKQSLHGATAAAVDTTDKKAQEDDGDGVGSTYEFPVEKKQFVETWLEKYSDKAGSDQATVVAADVANISVKDDASTSVMPKTHINVAMSFNPDLTRRPFGQRQL